MKKEHILKKFNEFQPKSINKYQCMRFITYTLENSITCEKISTPLLEEIKEHLINSIIFFGDKTKKEAIDFLDYYRVKSIESSKNIHLDYQKTNSRVFNDFYNYILRNIFGVKVKYCLGVLKSKGIDIKLDCYDLSDFFKKLEKYYKENETKYEEKVSLKGKNKEKSSEEVAENEIKSGN